MLYSPKDATGIRLKNIREAAGYRFKSDAVSACNETALSLESDVRFTMKKIRRFESIGITDRYGVKPPTYEELHIMMRTYAGSLGYLIWGLPPMLYPTDAYEDLLSVYLSPETLRHVAWLADMPKQKRIRIMQLLQEVIT
ncbi:MAG: hypothetical protein HWE39_12710 [Oceanospirillaceae bacterium]|nr:hypothetical protein [Oceanospirillaceae bacterium]